MAQTPIYQQVKHWLVGQIESGEMPDGSMLPPEHEIALRLGVSRPTVRQAMAELVHDGVVTRERGRGTTVLSRRMQYPVRRLLSLSEEYARRDHPVTSRVLRCELSSADEALARRLGVEPGASVFVLGRVRSVNDEAITYQESYIPATYVPGIDALDFEHVSLYRTLAERYGFEPHYGDEVITIGRATRREASLLEARLGDPVFHIERKSYMAGDRLLELVESVYRGDRYEIRLRLTR